MNHEKHLFLWVRRSCRIQASLVKAVTLEVKDSQAIIQIGDFLVPLERTSEGFELALLDKKGETLAPRLSLKKLEHILTSPKFKTFRHTLGSSRILSQLLIKLQMVATELEASSKERKKKRIPKVVDPEIEVKAQELLRQPNITERYMQHSGRWLKRDLTVRKAELMTFISRLGEYPLNLALQQVWASGKSTTSTFTGKYFQDEDVWFVGAISPKALIHERSVYDEEKEAYIINLNNKIIVFLDEPEYHTLMMLKPLLSHDKYEIMYRFVAKDTGKTEVAILRGWPGVIFCAVKSKYTEEYTSRWFTASPETDVGKIREVIEMKGDKAADPDTYIFGKEFEFWKRAFAILKEKAMEEPQKRFQVAIPFSRELAKHFRAKKPVDMRFFDLFLALIKASAILHAMQRERDEKGRLRATLQDYEEARSIFVEIEEPTVLGLGQNVLDFYERIVVPNTPTNYEDLVREYVLAYDKIIGRYQIREEYIKRLEAKGLVNLAPDPEDKRRVVITAIEELQSQSLIDHEGFRREIISEDVR